MLNLRESYYNPRRDLPGAETTTMPLTEMRFRGDGSRKGQGGRMQEFTSRGSEDCRMGLDTASIDHGATINLGTDILLHHLGTQRQESGSSRGNILFMEDTKDLA